MTPREADKIIKAGRVVTVSNIRRPNEKFSRFFVKRDRWNIYSADGGVFDRGELELVTT